MSARSSAFFPSHYFDNLLCKEASVRDEAFERLATLAASDRFALRETAGKMAGWSAFAVAGRSGLVGQWSRERFDRLLLDATPDMLNTQSCPGVPDGAWFWLGCLKAATRNYPRADRLWGSHQKLAKCWGEEALFEGILALRAALPTLDKTVQTAFKEAWRYAWMRMFEAGTHSPDEALKRWDRAWNGPKPRPVADKLFHEYAYHFAPASMLVEYLVTAERRAILRQVAASKGVDYHRRLRPQVPELKALCAVLRWGRQPDWVPSEEDVAIWRRVDQTFGNTLEENISQRKLRALERAIPEAVRQPRVRM